MSRRPPRRAALLALLALLIAPAGLEGGTVMPRNDEQADPVRNEITVAAPPEFVFPYVSDGDRIAQWSKDDKLEIAFPQGRQARVGMQIRFTIKLPTDPWWIVEIRKLEGGREMRTEILDGIFRGSICFFLAPAGENRTRLTHEAVILPQGSFMKFAWRTVGRDIHRQKMEEIMQRIKAIVEADYQAFRGRSAR